MYIHQIHDENFISKWYDVVMVNINEINHLGVKLLKKLMVLLVIQVVLLNSLPQAAAAKTASPSYILSAGWENSAVVTPDGTVFVWGNNEFGEVGNYQCGDYYYKTYDCVVIKPNAALNNVKAVSCVNESVYALRNDDSLWAWGFNHHGKLGNGNEDNQSVPVKILEKVKFIAGGHGLHEMAIKKDDSLWAWGWNEFYQLGDGTNINRSIPVKVMEHVKYASVGYGYSAVIKSDDSLWTWGDNSFGNLGNGNKELQKEPVQILEDVQTVSLGQTGGFALKKDGTLWAWGSNPHGEVGDGTRQNRLSPVKIMSGVVSISTMGLQHFMALKKDGTVWTWGVNNKGQLGDGKTKERLKPVKVMSNVVQINNGTNFSFAIKKDNTLWAWGSNNCGQLGTGDKKDRSKPVKIMDLDTFNDKGTYTKPARYLDGLTDDWEAVAPTISDLEDDSVNGAADLRDICVYQDKSNLYLSLSFQGEFSQAIFDLDYDGDQENEYQIMYDKTNNETYVFKEGDKGHKTYRTNYVNETLELSVPLSSIGKPKKFYLHCILNNPGDQSLSDETDEWSIVNMK